MGRRNAYPFFFVLALFLGCGKKPLEHSVISVEERDDLRLVHWEGVFLPSPHTTSSGASDVYSILEVMGGGISSLDFDLNGEPDLLVLGGGEFDSSKGLVTGRPCRLFRGIGERLVDVPGLGPPIEFYNLGSCRSDLNSDGFDDLVITGYRGLAILLNQGDGMFMRASIPNGVSQGLFAVAAIGADFNGDGWLDLYVSNYCDWSFENHPFCPSESDLPREICGPTAFQGLADLLLMATGDGQWVVPSEANGLNAEFDSRSKGMAVLAADLNQDHRFDVYVANDGQPNFLFLQKKPSEFVESGLAMGVAVGLDGKPNGSMGIGLGDFDRDQNTDLVITNFIYEPLALYRGRQGGHFTYGSIVSGLEKHPKSFVSWGVAFADLNNDGWQELIICNGQVSRKPNGGSPAQPGRLFVNRKGKFEERTEEIAPFFSQPHMARGLSLADFDGDHDLDIAVGMLDEPTVILRNVSDARPLLSIDLVGTHSTRDPVGAWIRVICEKEVLQTQWVSGGTYAGSHERRVWIGTGSDTPTAVEVHWPSGLVERHPWSSNALEALLVEGKGIWFR